MQALGVLAYGTRLASFLAARARKPSYKKAVGDAARAKTQNISLGAKLATWASCSILYACMFSPTNAVLGQVGVFVVAPLFTHLHCLCTGCCKQHCQVWHALAVCRLGPRV